MSIQVFQLIVEVFSEIIENFRYILLLFIIININVNINNIYYYYILFFYVC